ncbi:Predicted ATPase [Pasteurella testudinis DSM 23072]|uniref:Predicted ATPase n=1 Tax=Pasteurella testudinis DSM 23072 TaxID=1122938 RepID=A0A1W1UK54_9PAST|nr:primase-helicase family protein [Pasteurella testudinis]SMB81498.1 Predicted ATPase [Pasteurella testudinis DSM 23072]SUB51432.1 phage/plasmid primase, P4 family, C-terminal domain [Pasteurella testudinis]
MDVVFLEAGKPLRKSFDGSEITAYPVVKNFTSHLEQPTTLPEYADTLRKHAGLGHCLYKGLLKKPLVNESRRGQTQTESDTRFLVLDVDGLPLDIPGLRGAFNAAKLEVVAEQVVEQIPQLKNVSYVACASSSCGMADTARLHLHFMLDSAVAPNTLKTWLQKINVECFGDKLKLNPHGATLKYVIDPCLAENSRIIYVAPPEFVNEVNPFADDADRVIYVEKTMSVAPVSIEITNIDREQVHQAIERRLEELHEARGLKRSKTSTTKMRFDGVTRDVVNNPNKMHMKYAYHNEQFCYYNVGPTGDSNAYYVYLTNPEIVWNFKGEPPFLFEKADKETFDWHVEKFKDVKTEDGQTQKTPMIFLEDASSYYLVLYSKVEDAIIIDGTTGEKAKAEEWFNNYGRAVPDLIANGRRRFNPTSTITFEYDPESNYTYINTFRPTRYMKQALPDVMPGVGYRNAWLLQIVCPTIYKIISHMLNYDDATICHFLNWFAFIFQKRIKAETCWVLQGTQGTGKGAFYRNVVRPLWGEQYAFEKQLQNFEDDKNGWEEKAMLVLIDEVNMKSLRNSGKTEALLKNLITDDERTIRAMRKDQVQSKSYTNIIMSTNDFDALNIPDNDRRYNIAPRQEQMLRTAYPEFVEQREYVDGLLASEIEDMAAFLQHFNVNVTQAYTALDNQAKQDAREAGKSSGEAFFSAVRKADLDYFAAVFEAQETDQTMLVIAAKCRSIVSTWLVDCKMRRRSSVEIEQLRLLYQLIEGTRELTSNKFGRLCKKMGIGYTRVGTKRGVHVTWRMDADVLEAALANITDHDRRKFETAQAVNDMNKVGNTCNSNQMVQ